MSSATLATDTTVRRVIAASAFPVVMTAAVVIAHYAYINRYDVVAATGVIVVGSGFIIGVLERFFPHHESWLHSNGDLRVDMFYAPIISIASGIAASAVLVLGFVLASVASARYGAELWPTSWPMVFQVALALAIAEFPKYWHHRLQHETDFLWRFHATHHSAPRLYFLNAARFHPVDTYIDGICGLLPLIALGAGVEVLMMFTVISAVHGFFQHANIPIRIGPLNYVFSMAELHRWHHSRTIDEANRNYGQNIILWDLVFGTFYWPSDREPPEQIGLANLAAFPMGLFGQLASPFTWGRIKKNSGTTEPQSATGV